MRFGFIGRLVKNLGRSPQWPAVRAAHLKKEPSCQACGGTDHLEVHHIAPFHVSPALELDETNLITLCEKPGHCCHFVMGHFHDWSRWNPAVRDWAARYLAAQKAAP